MVRVARPFGNFIRGCSFLNFARSMAAEEERRKDDFRNFLDCLAGKPNSQLITDEKAVRIRKVLSGNGDAENARFRFYIRSKGFSVVDLPVLGLSGVLCAPAPKVSSNILLLIHIRIHNIIHVIKLSLIQHVDYYRYG